MAMKKKMLVKAAERMITVMLYQPIWWQRKRKNRIHKRHEDRGSVGKWERDYKFGRMIFVRQLFESTWELW